MVAALLGGDIGTDGIRVQSHSKPSIATSVPRLERKERGGRQAGRADWLRASASENLCIRQWHVLKRESAPHGWTSER